MASLYALPPHQSHYPGPVANGATPVENHGFSNHSSPQLFDLESPSSTGCLVAPEEVGRRNPVVVPRILDRETGGQFILGQNYPNPYAGQTTVPFILTSGGDVRLDLFDLAGRKVAGIVRKNMGAGEQTISLNLEGLGLPAGDYVYQLQVTNTRGVYRQSKMMTAG